jgi:hypothetical protein
MDPRERFNQASNQYLPHSLKLLFLAESPPALRFNRFFYFPNLTEGDSLFLEMMKVLYPDQVGFSGIAFSPGFSAKGIRARKDQLLTRFQRDGHYLIDACEMPMDDDATVSEKTALMKASLPSLIQRLKNLVPRKKTPIVIIGAVTFSVCSGPLRLDGWNVVNDTPIKHPARGGQIAFRSQLRAALDSHYSERASNSFASLRRRCLNQKI